MARPLLHYFFTFCILSLFTLNTYAQKFGFDQLVQEQPDRISAFAIPNTVQNKNTIDLHRIPIKSINDDWLYISTTPVWIDIQLKSGSISDFHFELSNPVALDDSARALHWVDTVNSGGGGLKMPYTGKGVIMGYIDTGIDWGHEDFWNEDSLNRVLRIWDQNLSTGSAPQPYNYGSVYDSSHINAINCPSIDTQGHGSMVAGQGSGNGRANGTNKGMAPDCDIVVVKSNFSAPNWTLTVADGIDYIFKVADSLGKPAVINLSLGTYLGSHDGNDAASAMIESLLDEHPGRIVISAAGNGGTEPPFHAQSTMNASDTVFTWFINNPAGAYGPNTILFDIWSDIGDATWDFALGADKVNPSYELRGMTQFRGATSSLGVPILDTIWNGSNQIATVEIYTGTSGGAFNMLVFFSQIDSTDYRFRFSTTGSGKYDLWSGAFLGLNNMEENIPSVGVYPPIANYVMPDTLQTIVSSWNCSEKVISVANVMNRMNYETVCAGTYTVPNYPGRGHRWRASSNGPNRHNAIKPEIGGAGEVSLGPNTLWNLSVPGNCVVIDSGGWHWRNGGTSMAAPSIAGIAALYLEHCSNASYTQFRNDLFNTADVQPFMGAIPNNYYGYGNANALDLMLGTEFNPSIVGDTTKCDELVTLSVNSPLLVDSVVWWNGINNLTLDADSGYKYATVYDIRSCSAVTDSHYIEQLIVPTISNISIWNDSLTAVASDGYQWTLDGSDLIGETNSTVSYPPYGNYSCYTISVDGCIAYSDTVGIYLSVPELEHNQLIGYPNPVINEFRIETDVQIKKVSLISATGQIAKEFEGEHAAYDVSGLSPGSYEVLIETSDEIYVTKISVMQK